MASLTLPYVRLNLRRNPFGELDEDERAALAVVDVDALAARLRTPGFRVQFVGEKGAGKTTHLLALKTLLPEARYVRCDRSEPIPRAPILLLDEADRVPAVSCALGVHRPLPGCLTIHLRSLGLPRLQTIVERRIEHVRRGPGPLPRVERDELEALIRSFGNDVRGIFDHLYEAFQRGQVRPANHV